MLSESNSRQEPSVNRNTFILEKMHSCDRFSIYTLTTANGAQANYCIFPQDHEEITITSFIMDWCHLNQYTAKYLPAELQLDQPAYVHLNVLAADFDTFWCRYSHLESSVEVTSMGFCSANDHSGIGNRRGCC